MNNTAAQKVLVVVLAVVVVVVVVWEDNPILQLLVKLARPQGLSDQADHHPKACENYLGSFLVLGHWEEKVRMLEIPKERLQE